MKKVAIIIPYFGDKFPSNFDAWMLSASYNSTITFFIITNIDFSKFSSYKNIVFIKQNWNDFQSFVQAKFDFTINLEKPYKLCDYKAAYGYIFSSIINSSFDYWGYCDIDLIFGDLNQYLKNALEMGYDKIGIWGHLSLFKNNPSMNKLFMKDIKDIHTFSYKDVFKTPVACYFDEIQGIGLRTIEYNKSVYSAFSSEIADIDQKYLYFKTINKQKVKWFKWEKGHLFMTLESGKMLECPYAHFQKRKLKELEKPNSLFFIYNNLISNSNHYKKEKAGSSLFYYLSNRINYYCNSKNNVDPELMKKIKTTSHYCINKGLYSVDFWQKYGENYESRA